jgi:DNA-binding GntR family transcriptional regulator
MKAKANSAMRAPLLSKSTLAEQVYDVLKGRILDQALEPGARLNIDALSKDLSVSSSPIREALARLEAERLIVSELYSGYSVAPQPPPSYLNQVLDFRILLEGACARIGAGARDPEILESLRKSLATMSKTHRLGTRYQQYRKFVQADLQFHLTVVNSARNEVFTEIYSKMHAIAGMHAILLQSRLYINRKAPPTSSEGVVNEHRAIFEAFERGDGAAAEKALCEHLEGGRKRVMAAIEASKSADEAIKSKQLAVPAMSKVARRGRPRKTVSGI